MRVVFVAALAAELGLMVLVAACGSSRTCPPGSVPVGSSCADVDAGLPDGGRRDGGALDAFGADATGDADPCASCPDDGDECTAWSSCEPACVRAPLSNVLCDDGDGVCMAGACERVHALYTTSASSGEREVYAAPVDGSGEARRLSPELPPDRRLAIWDLSDDRRFFVYVADQETAGVDELFAAPIDGSAAPVKLNLPLAAREEVLAWRTPRVQAGTVVYQTTSDDLYAVALDGSGGRQLNDEPVDRFVLTRDGHLVYATTADSRDLFLTDLSGTPPRRLHPPLSAGARVAEFRPSVDERHVYYLADQDSAGVFELYRVALDGGAATKVNPPLVAGGDVQTFAPLDDGRVLYLADQDTDDVFELYLADDSGALRLSEGGQVGDFQSYLAPPELGPGSVGEHVLFVADPDGSGTFDLFAAGLDGSRVVRLNAPLPSGASIRQFFFSADSERAVYSADQDVVGTVELYSVRLDGTGRTKLNGRLTTGGQVRASLPRLDGPWVIYMADEERLDVVEAFAARVDGSERLRLNEPLVAGGDVVDVLLANLGARSAWAVYLADEDVDEVIEVFARHLDGTAHVKLNAPLPVGRSVDFAFQTPLPL